MMFVCGGKEHSDEHPEHNRRNETYMRADEEEAADKCAAPKEFK